MAISLDYGVGWVGGWQGTFSPAADFTGNR